MTIVTKDGYDIDNTYSDSIYEVYAHDEWDENGQTPLLYRGTLIGCFAYIESKTWNKGYTER